MDFGRMIRQGAVGVLVAAVGGGSPAWAAGDGIAATGRRLVSDAVRHDAPASVVRTLPVPERAAAPVAAARDDAVEQTPGLTRSGMSRGKKIALGLGLAVAFGAVVWTIDHNVEDNTPSSRGLR